MADSYTIRDQYAQHFITCTVHQWVDVFTREAYIQIVLDSLRFCQKEKGLRIYGWVIMTNHLHMIVDSNKVSLSDIIRDFKKYTATQIIKAIETNPRESRKNWLLWLLKKDGHVWFWEEGYHGEEIFSASFFETKLEYIHMNPVKSGIVIKEEEYAWSSCADIYGVRKGPIELAQV